jgi:uncharacterized protein YbjT (DUF2867 family)
MIVVTTPTGQIGSKVVRHLLAANEAVRVVVRDPAKLSAEVLAKAQVVQGSTEDEAVLYAAFEGAESVFWVVPPSFQASDITAYYLQFTRPAARAIQARGVKRVVSISALGRGHALKSGLGDASYAMVEELEKTGADTRALYCPGFMENMLHHVQSLKYQCSFSLPGPADWKVPLALVAKGQGLDNAVERTAENTTPTTFKQWATQVLRPVVIN